MASPIIGIKLEGVRLHRSGQNMASSHEVQLASRSGQRWEFKKRQVETKKKIKKRLKRSFSCFFASFELLLFYCADYFILEPGISHPQIKSELDTSH